jgi:radical SAM protein with 4Fe4S-binding SPASM domain
MCDIPQNRIDELSTFQWKQVIKDAASCGTRAIIFSGGEPLLREDIFELISFTKDNSMDACLTSNGYLIDNEVSGKFRRAGIDVVNISIEGPQRIHDYMRGKGMFEKAIIALENLRKHKIESTIATMVSRYNYKYLTYVGELARQYGVTTIKFQPFSKIFLSNQQGGENFLISDRKIEAIRQIIGRVIKFCNNHAIATNPAGYLEMIPFYLGRRHIKSNNGCGALEDSCPINPNGDIYPCWALADKDTLIGNLKEDSFLNIWDSPRRRSLIEKIKKEGCPGCMMSCYDDNFGKEALQRRIVMNVRRLQKKGAREYMRGILKKWAKRLKFYSSYRGSLKGIMNRICGSLIKKKPVNVKPAQEEIDKAIKEIESAKQILEEELKRSR